MKLHALYRMTIGQQRQEELLNLLKNMHLSDEQLKELTIDLCPYNKKEYWLWNKFFQILIKEFISSLIVNNNQMFYELGLLSCDRHVKEWSQHNKNHTGSQQIFCKIDQCNDSFLRSTKWLYNT